MQQRCSYDLMESIPVCEPVPTTFMGGLRPAGDVLPRRWREGHRGRPRLIPHGTEAGNPHDMGRSC
jgi:hypothetical protein